jgi:hypothetical protein
MENLSEVFPLVTVIAAGPSRGAFQAPTSSQGET